MKICQDLLPAAAGIVLSLCFLFIPKFFKSLLPQLSGYIVGGGLVLLYFTALRIHFLEKDPLIESAGGALIFLNVVFILSLYIALKRESVYLTNLSIILWVFDGDTRGKSLLHFCMDNNHSGVKCLY